MRNSKLTALLAGLMAVGLTGHARAGTFTYNSYSVLPSDTVYITDTALGVNAEGADAGMIVLTGGGKTFDAFCVDISDVLQGSATYSTGGDPMTNTNLIGNSTLTGLTGQSKINDIIALIAHGTDFEAIQLAIWSVEYGNGLSYTGESDGSTVTAYLADLKNGIFTKPQGWTLAELTPVGGANQTLVYAPEPASIAVFGLALTGIAAVRRRRTQTV